MTTHKEKVLAHYKDYTDRAGEDNRSNFVLSCNKKRLLPIVFTIWQQPFFVMPKLFPH